MIDLRETWHLLVNRSLLQRNGGFMEGREEAIYKEKDKENEKHYINVSNPSFSFM